jgi:hypothetical protein
MPTMAMCGENMIVISASNPSEICLIWPPALRRLRGCHAQLFNCSSVKRIFPLSKEALAGCGAQLLAQPLSISSRAAWYSFSLCLRKALVQTVSPYPREPSLSLASRDGFCRSSIPRRTRRAGPGRGAGRRCIIIGAMMRKLVHVAFGVLKSGKAFNPAMHGA